MGRTTRCGRCLLAALVAVFGITTTAEAIYLDQEQNVSLRVRAYSQASIRTEKSEEDTVPAVFSGQLVSHRNFFNPELDAKLTAYTAFLKNTPLDFLAPDDFAGRVAGWGFYDGVYDYGAKQINHAGRAVNASFGDLTTTPRHAWFLEGPGFNCVTRVPNRPGQPCVGGVHQEQTSSGTLVNRYDNYTSVEDAFPGYEVQNVRDIYAHRQRVNELYLNYAKGPVFVRIGRQAISWGESDTVALLDQNNPFDITLGPPGLFQDLDQARIPLWTIRSSVNLFDNLGPLSSGFIEAYWVPGDLDTETGTLPILTASPYSVRGDDPNNQPLLRNVQFVLIDAVPKKRFENSRWGVRAQTVVASQFTVQAWYYTHFPNAPVPLKRPIALIGPGAGTSLFIIETVHQLTSVVGAATSFFLEPVDGIVRAEAEYFDNEPAFIPDENLKISSIDPVRAEGRLPHADFLRWELGFDRFFFVRPLNPSNSFLIVTALVGSYNFDETGRQDFRYNGQQKPGGKGISPLDYVDLKQFEGFAQIHLQTDYLHGRLSPGATVIGNLRGTWTVNPTLTYRLTDWLLFDLSGIVTGGAYQQLGFYKDRDQVSARVTYQLN